MSSSKPFIVLIMFLLILAVGCSSAPVDTEESEGNGSTASSESSRSPSAESASEEEAPPDTASPERSTSSAAETPKGAASAQQSMVLIPAGAFPFGATEEQFSQFFQATTVYFPGMEYELKKQFVIPPQMVTLPEYYIDKFEVTNEEYSEFLEATGYRPESSESFLSHWNSRRQPPKWAASFPVVWVSQGDAQAYCEWKGKRLPTDQEWEKAARGPTGSLYPWGPEPPTPEKANYMGSELEPAGNRPEDASSYDVYDLAANAAEVTGSTIEFEGESRAVARGGSYKTQSRELRTFYRFFVDPAERFDYLGFRCASDVR